MLFALDHHPLDPNPLNHYGPGERLSERGWLSYSYTACSGAEYRVAKTMAEADPENIYVSFKRYADAVKIENDTCGYHETQMTVYASSQEKLDAVKDAILALPQRTTEMVIHSPEDAKMASRLARGSNHRLVVVKPDVDWHIAQPDPLWVLSIEENVAAVQIKLSLP